MLSHGIGLVSSDRLLFQEPLPAAAFAYCGEGVANCIGCQPYTANIPAFGIQKG